ncbi:MAG: SAM-dependent methyltransferase, partial [Nitrospirae bacterium]|nr:SAM-dependent methyltransferase [Nitrospirota bacterium]
METLTEILKARISIHGKIPFAEFMAEALYHPDLGYYSSERTRIGKAGDYFTSPTVHPAFGGLICKELQEMWQITGGEEFSIVEMGGGNGALCHDILKYAKERHPSFYRVLKYIIIEESAYMRKIQRSR